MTQDIPNELVQRVADAYCQHYTFEPACQGCVVTVRFTLSLVTPDDALELARVLGALTEERSPGLLVWNEDRTALREIAECRLVSPWREEEQNDG